MPQQFDVRLTTANKLEGLLLAEAQNLGLEAAKETRGAVYGRASLATIYDLLLGSRLASRLLLPLTTVPADDADAFYRGLRSFAWEDHIAWPLKLAVQCHGRTAAIRHTRFAAQRVKDAIADRARAQATTISVDRDNPDTRISVRLRDDGAEIALDLSGDSLHRRGYRQDTVEAPLKEPLAAAILIRAGWPDQADEGKVLFDPCCGAGTLLAEGAMIATGMAPGLLRRAFGLGGWRSHDPACWRSRREAAAASVRRDAGGLPSIIGHDRDTSAVAATRANMERLDLPCSWEVGVADVQHDDAAWPPGPGLLVTNPPYGHRMASRDGSDDTLYERLGGRARKELPGWRLAVVSDRSERLARLGLRSSRLYHLMNGRLDCHVGVYDIATPSSDTGSRPMKPGQPDAALSNRLLKNDRHLTRWRRRENVGAYRTYDTDMPEYPVAIEIYATATGSQARIIPRSTGAHPVNPISSRAMRRVTASVVATFQLGEEAIHLIRHTVPNGAAIDTDAQNHTAGVIQEGAARFKVAVTAPATGVDISQRGLRQRLHREAHNRRVLDLFASTGTATIQAAMGGASTTTSIEPSHVGSGWLRDNLTLNGLPEGCGHDIIMDDPASWLPKATERGQSWDIIVLNAVTAFDGHGDDPVQGHDAPIGELMRLAKRALAPGGWMYVTTQREGSAPGPAETVEWGGTEITRGVLPPDYRRQTPAWRCWLISAHANR